MLCHSPWSEELSRWTLQDTLFFFNPTDKPSQNPTWIEGFSWVDVMLHIKKSIAGIRTKVLDASSPYSKCVCVRGTTCWAYFLARHHSVATTTDVKKQGWLSTYTVRLRVKPWFAVSRCRGSNDAGAGADVSAGDQLTFQDAGDAWKRSISGVTVGILYFWLKKLYALNPKTK